MVMVTSTKPSQIIVEGWTDDDDSTYPTLTNASVDKLTCSKSVDNFNRETARYCSMIVGLGGSRDTTKLRHDLRRCRQRAFTLARVIRTNLVPLMKQTLKQTSESDELERLYRLFSSNLEHLHIQLVITLSLQRFFPLPQKGDVLVVHTGIVDPVLSSKLSVQDGFDIFAVDWNDADDSNMLLKQIRELQQITHDVNQRFDIQPWDAMPNLDISQYETKSLESEIGTTTADLITIHEPTLRRRRRCLCVVALTVVSLAVAGIIIGVVVSLVLT